jgi:hypothetical protein
MKNNSYVINLDHYYLDIEDKILAVAAYTENKNAEQILKICRFKPYPIQPKRSLHKSLYRYWVDEYSNSIEIKNKRLNITLNDLKINKKNIISTDIYKGLDISKIYKISKLMYIFKGTELDFKTNHYILSFMGIDNYLRTYSYCYDEWSQIPSIYLGINVLNSIIDNLDIQFFKNFNFKNKIIFECDNQQAILGKIPISKFFNDELRNEYNFILNTLSKGDNN